MSRVPVWVALVASLAVAAPVCAGEVERLRAENARLADRVRVLETENAALRSAPSSRDTSLAAALEQRATETVTVAPGAGGTEVVQTEASRLDGIGGGKSRHWITWRAQRPTGSAAAPASALMIIASADSGIAYRDVQTVRLGVDGAPVDCAVADYTSRINTTGRDVSNRTRGESVSVAVPPATLAQLATAREVSGTLGRTTFRLTPQQLAELRAFAKRLGS